MDRFVPRDDASHVMATAIPPIMASAARQFPLPVIASEARQSLIPVIASEARQSMTNPKHKDTP